MNTVITSKQVTDAISLLRQIAEQTQRTNRLLYAMLSPEQKQKVDAQSLADASRKIGSSSQP
jgi:hypothetical protein